jgi:hypothetical protein
LPITLEFAMPARTVVRFAGLLAMGFTQFSGQDSAVMAEEARSTITTIIFGLEAGQPTLVTESLPAGTNAPIPSADELRKRYPYESLADRLKYESRPVARTRRAAPRLGKLARERLEQADSLPEVIQPIRAQSLEMLHTDKVAEFISKSGFGVGRMVTIEPSPRFLDYPDGLPVVAAPRRANSAEEEHSEVVQLPATGVREEGKGAWSPSIDLLSQFHAGDQAIFASLPSFGHIKDRRNVAGFRSHAFNWLPELIHPANDYVDNQETHPARWRVGRLELVSLLKYERPAVYVSEHLPRMNELKDAKTRPLAPFEKESLEKLMRGEEIISVARSNDIQMVGALRASRQCLKCHQVQHGELLGAFSYDLFRDPPVKIEKPRQEPAT